MVRRIPDERQGDLFFAQPRPPTVESGAMNVSVELRNALARALKECPLSRTEVACRMTDLLFGDVGEGEVSKSQLDAWTAPSKGDWRFPLEYLPAFVQVTGAVGLLDWVAGKCGCRVLQGEQALLVELGAIMLHERRLKQARTNLERRVPGNVLDRLIKRLEAQDA